MSKKKRICFIVPVHFSGAMGGAEYQVKCILDELIKQKSFEIFYLTCLYDPLFHSDDYKIVQISNPLGIVQRYGKFFDCFKLIKLLKHIKPDVIYQRTSSAYTGAVAHYAKTHSCKTILHLAHDLDVLPFNETLTLRSMIRFIDKKFFEFGIKHTHEIIAQTNQQAKYLKQHYSITASRRIQNFHPLPKEKIKKEASKTTIVWVANFKPIKQPEKFIQLANDLYKKNKNVECIMVGRPLSSGHPWQKALDQKIAKLPNLVHLKSLPIQEVNLLLAKANIFVNTSSYEGFANTFIQAWMRSVPVISLNVNPDNIFDRHKIGFYAGSYTKMLEKVNTLIEDKNLCELMGKKAKMYAFQNHSMNNISNVLSTLKAS